MIIVGGVAQNVVFGLVVEDGLTLIATSLNRPTDCLSGRDRRIAINKRAQQGNTNKKNSKKAKLDVEYAAKQLVGVPRPRLELFHSPEKGGLTCHLPYRYWLGFSTR